MAKTDLSLKLEELKKSENVVLTDLVINDNSCMQISQFIKSNDILVNLEGMNGYITSTGLASLSDAIANSTALKKVSFAHNQISDEDENSFQSFCSAVAINKSITELNLSYNSIGIKCSKYIANLIRSNQILRNVDLSYNTLKNEGCKIILESLPFNSSLKTLNLEGNEASNEVLQKINLYLKENQSSKFQSPSLQSKNHFSSDAFTKSQILNPTDVNKLSSPKQDLNYTSVNESAYNYDRLIIDYKSLQDEYNTARRNFENEKIGLDLYKSGYTQTIENERNIRLRAEAQVTELRQLLNKTDQEYKTLMANQKRQFNEEKLNFETVLTTKEVEFSQLKSIYTQIERNNSELQISLTNLNREKINLIEEHEEQKLKFQKEFEISREELIKVIEQEKNKMSMLEVEYSNCKEIAHEWENKYNALLEDFDEKLRIERQNQLNSQNEIKQYSAKLTESDESIKKLRAESYENNEEIIKMKKKYELENNQLKEILQRNDLEFRQRIEEDQEKMKYFEQLIDQTKKQYNEEANRRIKEAKEKNEMAISSLNRKLEEYISKIDYYESTKNKLEDEITKVRAINTECKSKYESDIQQIQAALYEKFNNEKTSMITQYEGNLTKLYNNRDEFAKKNEELVQEIQNMQKEISKASTYANEINALREDNISLNNAYEDAKAQLSSSEKEFSKMQISINNSEKSLALLKNENLKLVSELQNMSQSIKDTKILHASLLDLESKYNNMKNKAAFYENELAKIKLYNDRLADQNDMLKSELSSNSVREYPMPPPNHSYIQSSVRLPHSPMYASYHNQPQFPPQYN